MRFYWTQDNHYIDITVGTQNEHMLYNGRKPISCEITTWERSEYMDKYISAYAWKMWEGYLKSFVIPLLASKSRTDVNVVCTYSERK